jgi:hypothetical protein
MEVTLRGICPRNCIHQRDTQHSCGCQFPNLSITQKSTQLMNRVLPTLGFPPRATVGTALQHYGILTMRRTRAHMDKTAIQTMCLQIVPMRRRFILSLPKRSQTLKGSMQQSSTASSATMSSIRTWISGCLTKFQ